MFKRFQNEFVLGLAVIFMAFYPPVVGAILFTAALGLIIILRVIEYKESPDILRLKDDVKDLKVKVEQLILGRNR